MTLSRLLFVLFASAGVVSLAPAQERENRLYELRTYTAPAGKLDALNARFRDHTVKLFEKHGMTNVGYWVPIDNPDNKLIYILSYPNKSAREQSWKAFHADPAWQAARKASEANGPIVSNVKAIFLKLTDYSPAVPSGGSGDRVFELRTYTTVEGKLPALNARFRDHTMKLFQKHGMTNIAYWTPVEKEQGADNTLVYLLAHKSVDAAKASFDAFRKDPAWVAARTASEQNAGGPLTVKDGVKSVFLKATDYSPLK